MFRMMRACINTIHDSNATPDLFMPNEVTRFLQQFSSPVADVPVVNVQTWYDSDEH
jgi:hypothetical protein